MIKTKSINISIEFKKDYISREAGERLRNIILEAKKEQTVLTLDFQGIIIASTSFFDEGIAKLVDENWNKKTLNQYVTFKDLNPHDKKVLNTVCKYRGLELEN